MIQCSTQILCMFYAMLVSFFNGQLTHWSCCTFLKLQKCTDEGPCKIVTIWVIWGIKKCVEMTRFLMEGESCLGDLGKWGWTTDRVVGWMDGWMAGWMTGWLDGWMDGWMNGWLDDWMVGWMDGWMVDGWNGWLDGRRFQVRRFVRSGFSTCDSVGGCKPPTSMSSHCEGP